MDTKDKYRESTSHYTHEKRSELRKVTDKYYSVEFKAEASGWLYRFRLRDISSNGICILVKETSDLLQQIRVNDTLDMKYYSEKSLEKPENIRTKIQHITKDELGRYQGDYFVGLEILQALKKPVKVVK